MVMPVSGGYFIALADGAGGISGGDLAAQYAVDALAATALAAPSADWCAVLTQLDCELSAHPSGGQTTVVAAYVSSERVVGASVGDSCAWLILDDRILDLTEVQHRRPLLGTGDAQPTRFEAQRQGGRVLFGSDGLFKYARADRIANLAGTGSVEMSARALAECVRLPSGVLQDDVAVILVAG